MSRAWPKPPIRHRAYMLTQTIYLCMPYAQNPVARRSPPASAFRHRWTTCSSCPTNPADSRLTNPAADSRPTNPAGSRLTNIPSPPRFPAGDAPPASLRLRSAPAALRPRSAALSSGAMRAEPIQSDPASGSAGEKRPLGTRLDIFLGIVLPPHEADAAARTLPRPAPGGRCHGRDEGTACRERVARPHCDPASCRRPRRVLCAHTSYLHASTRNGEAHRHPAPTHAGLAFWLAGPMPPLETNTRSGVNRARTPRGMQAGEYRHACSGPASQPAVLCTFKQPARWRNCTAAACARLRTGCIAGQLDSWMDSWIAGTLATGPRRLDGRTDGRGPDCGARITARQTAAQTSQPPLPTLFT